MYINGRFPTRQVRLSATFRRFSLSVIETSGAKFRNTTALDSPPRSIIRQHLSGRIIESGPYDGINSEGASEHKMHLLVYNIIWGSLGISIGELFGTTTSPS